MFYQVSAMAMKGIYPRNVLLFTHFVPTENPARHLEAFTKNPDGTFSAKPLAHLTVALQAAGHMDADHLGFDYLIEKNRGPFSLEQAMMFSEVIELLNQAGHEMDTQSPGSEEVNTHSNGFSIPAIFYVL